MSTSVPPENPTPPATTSPSPAATGSTSAEWRAPANAPSWAAGKSPEEILGIAEKLAGALQSHVQNPGQQTPPRDPSTGQWTAAPATPTPAYDPDSYIQRRDIETLAPQLIQQATNGQFDRVYENLASSNLEMVRRANGTIFEKYGPEVNAYIAKLPIQQRTVDNLTTVVKLVRADHVDELAGEIASRRVAEMEPTLRSNGSPSVPVASTEPNYTLQSPNIPDDWKDRAARAGLTESAVDEFCRANDISREAFFSQFGTTAITEARR